jgi:hypothetical protein
MTVFSGAGQSSNQKPSHVKYSPLPFRTALAHRVLLVQGGEVAWLDPLDLLQLGNWPEPRPQRLAGLAGVVGVLVLAGGHGGQAQHVPRLPFTRGGLG